MFNKGKNQAPVCQICGKPGHTADKCWHRSSQTGGNSSGRGQQQPIGGNRGARGSGRGAQGRRGGRFAAMADDQPYGMEVTPHTTFVLPPDTADQHDQQEN